MTERPSATGSTDIAPTPDGEAASVVKSVQPDTTDPAEFTARTLTEWFAYGRTPLTEVLRVDDDTYNGSGSCSSFEGPYSSA